MILKLLIFLGITLLACILIALSTDAIIHLYEWQSRIHIGKWNNIEEWNNALKKKGLEWLKEVPTIRMTDQNRLFLIDIIRGRYKSNAIQIWQYAGLLIGLEKINVNTFIKCHPNYWDHNNIYPEHLLLGYVLKQKGLLSETQEKDLEKFINSSSQQGTFPYRVWTKDIRFVDTIGMTLPYLHAAGHDSLAEKQLNQFDEVLLKGVFPPHAFNIQTKVPMGVYDWCRGIGWYILGLILTSDMNGHKERIIKLSNSLLPFQNSKGGYNCFIFNKNERPETSGTILIGLLFLKAYELTCKSEYLTAAYNIEKYLMTITRRDGTVDFCQGDTYGIGYYSRLYSGMPFAQGLAILFTKEFDKIRNANN